MGDRPTWVSGHVHFRGSAYSPACDTLILDVIAPFVRSLVRAGTVREFFFVRYSVGGPHVRVRLCGRTAQEEGGMRAAFESHIRGCRLEARRSPESQVGGYPLRLEWRQYEPEIERYGGQEGMRLAERFFWLSSRTAIALIEEFRNGGTTARLARALLTMIVLIRAFLTERGAAAEFLANYGGNYLRAVARQERVHGEMLEAFSSGYDRQAETLSEYVNEVWRRMTCDESLSAALDDYAAGLVAIRDQFAEIVGRGKLCRSGEPLEEWQAAVRAVVSSYMHMMNNRLGITVVDEAYLAYLAARALDHGVGTEWSAYRHG